MEQPARCWLANGRLVWVNGVGVVEVVVCMNVGFVENGAGCAGDAGSVDDDFGGQGLVEVRVHHGDGDLLAISCRRDGGRPAEARESPAGIERSAIAVPACRNRRIRERVADTRCSEFGAYGLGSTVRQVHLEDVEGGLQERASCGCRK